MLKLQWGICSRSALHRYLTTSRRYSPTFDTIYQDSASLPNPPSLVPRRGDRGGTVVVGMSGGVDSSVSAMLLAKQDYDLSAVYMRNWDTRDESGTDKGCEWERDWEDVQLVCKKLDIPCELIDLSKEYWNRVFEPSLRKWEEGVSPNPDVWCNKEIKFGALLENLPSKDPTESSNDTWFATGHYASKSWHNNGLPDSPPSAGNRPRPQLLRPRDKNKDQTYFLSSISESGLSRALFPLADLTKPEVRELAKKNGLSTAERPDSVGICFVGEKNKFEGFLNSYIPPNPGVIIDQLTGKEIGKHNGLWNFTIGQNARISGLKRKMFVVKKDVKTNTIFVVPGSQHVSLYSHTIYVSNFTWIWANSPPEGIDSLEGASLQLRHRYRMDPTECIVTRPWKDRQSDLKIDCPSPQHTVTPGQVAVLYRGDWCLGSGIITSST